MSTAVPEAEIYRIGRRLIQENPDVWRGKPWARHVLRSIAEILYKDGWRARLTEPPADFSLPPVGSGDHPLGYYEWIEQAGDDSDDEEDND